MEMKIKSQVQFNDDLSQRSNIVSGDSLSNSFAKIHHDLNDYEIAANIAANDRPKNLLYIHDILSDSVSTATEEILGYPLEAGTYVYSAEIYTVQNPSVANVTKIEFLGADGNTVVGTCNIACDTKKEEHTNITLSDEAYYIKYYRDTYSSGTVGYLKTSKQMICLPNVYVAFPEYTMYAPSLGETFLEVEDSVKTYDVQDTYNSSSYKAISGKGVAAALGTLEVSSVGGTGKVISAISETGGIIDATEVTMDTTPTANSTVPVTSGGVAASQAEQDAEIAVIANAGAKNFLNPNLKSKTVDGVTYTLQSDGRIIANGTAASASLVASFYGGQFTIPAGDWLLNGCPSGGSTASYMVQIKDNSHPENPADGTVLYRDFGTGDVLISISTETAFMYVIRVANGYTANNLIFKPMIRPASITDSNFQPYALPNPILTPALVEQVNEGAKNLVDTSTVMSGVVTFMQDSDYYVTASPNNTDPRLLEYANSQYKFRLPAGNYVLSMDIMETTSQKNAICWVYKSDGTNIANKSIQDLSGLQTLQFTLSAETNIGILIKLYTAKLRLMVCTKTAWDISHQFEPYALPNPTLTPAVIKAVDEGAKNLLQLFQLGSSNTNVGNPCTSQGVEYEIQSDGTITAYRKSSSSYGAYIFLYKNGEIQNVSELFDGNHIWSGNPPQYPDGGVSVWYKIGSGSNITLPNGTLLPNANGEAVQIGFQISTILSPTQSNPIVFKPMICTASDWAVSQKFVPYRPSWQEMWEMIQTLQNNS